VETAITDYECSTQAPTLTFGVKNSIRAVFTWKRPGVSAAHPPEAIGSIVHSFDTPDTAFPRGNEPKTPTKVFGFSCGTIPLKTAKNPLH
jgi:hypothetical protein